MNSLDTLADGSKYDFWEKEINYTRELYVDCENPKASDSNDGTKEQPFKTIQAAADVATPGTHVWISDGVYRECVRPKKGGDGADSMICYEAVNKGKAIIKASEHVTEFAPSHQWSLWGFDDPANHFIEISCREQCFAPDIPFLSYVKITGLVCAHASMGAPVPQRGAIVWIFAHGRSSTDLI